MRTCLHIIIKSLQPNWYLPAKINNRNTRTRCEIYLELTIKTAERRQWRRSGVFIINFEHISQHVLVVLFFNFAHVIADWSERKTLVSVHCLQIHFFLAIDSTDVYDLSPMEKLILKIFLILLLIFFHPPNCFQGYHKIYREHQILGVAEVAGRVGS